MVYLRKDCILREYHTILNRICQYCTAYMSLFWHSTASGQRQEMIQNSLHGRAVIQYLYTDPGLTPTLTSAQLEVIFRNIFRYISVTANKQHVALLPPLQVVLNTVNIPFVFMCSVHRCNIMFRDNQIIKLFLQDRVILIVNII